MPETFTVNGEDFTLPSPNGLTFESKAAAYQLIVRDPIPKYDHGIKIGEDKELVLDFGDMGARAYHDAEQDYEGNTGTSDYYQIRGHFANTLVQAKQKNWTDEERALVEKKALVNQRPDAHWLKTKAPAPKPWPTYDETPFDKIAEFARLSGLVNEALVYESENKARKTVLAELAKKQAEPEVIEAVEA